MNYLVDTFVPVDAKEEIQSRFDKMVKRAIRIGFPTPSIKWGQIQLGNLQGPFAEDAEGIIQDAGTTNVLQWQKLQITGEPLKLGDWTLVASIDPLTIENDEVAYFRPVPGATVPQEWRQTDPRKCDHCKALRYRTETFLITDGTEFKQVGRQCIRDFLGHSPDVIANYIRFIMEMYGWFNSQDEGGWLGFKEATRWLPDSVIRVTARVVAFDGFFVSRKKEREAHDEGNFSVVATASTVLDILNPPSNQYGKELIQKYAAANQERVDHLYELTKTELNKLQMYDDNDWKANLYVASHANTIGFKQIGVLVSGILLGIRKDEQMIKEREDYLRNKAEGKPESNYVGSVGERVTVEVTIMDVKEINADGAYFATSYLVSMIDSAGNTLKWFASNPPAAVEKDAKLTLVGTVKKHDEWKGQKQTLLTRCKVK